MGRTLENKPTHMRDGKKYVGSETDTKKCGNCKKILSISLFRSSGTFRGDGSCYPHHICADCHVRIKQESRSALKHAPYDKTEFCECCSSNELKLEIDHIHGTNQFRGWICGQCNQGMGKLGDDLDGVLMAAKYLAKGNITMIIDKLTGIVRDTSNDPFKGTNMEGKD